MTKITMLGAGSAFTQKLMTDIMMIDGLDAAELCLVDVDKRRLDIMNKVVSRIAEEIPGQWKVRASVDRRKVMKNSDYIINSIEVSGLKAVRHDNDIPLKYGIDQCIGDTIGPGGIFKALRTVPSWIDILKDVDRYCPRALVMNYTNPMSIMTLGATRHTDQPFVGLCHSVQGTSRHIANLAGIPYEELVWRCGGINHMAWFTELTHRGEDVYPILRAAAEDEEFREGDPVRIEIMKQFGYYVTESSGHFSEYVPYFRKRKDLLETYCRGGYLGGSSFYADHWPTWREKTDAERLAMADGKQEIPLRRGHEYASDIIEAHALDRPKTIYASVPNTGLIPNLPLNGVVEVAVLVDRRGYTPTYFGPLPEQVAALCRANMAVFELCAQGILDHDREAIVHAMMVDPLSAAVCSPAEIRAMADALFAAEKEFIPSWCAAPRHAGETATPDRRVRPGTPADGAVEVSSMAARNVAEA